MASDDPVDDCERRRNDVVYDYQDNRNPFVDHPEWVCIIWGAETPCQSVTTPTPTITPTSGQPGSGDPWINEIHYDDNTKDSNEGVEVAGPAGLNMSGYSLVAYNGSNGLVYNTIALSGTLTDQQECIGTQWYAIAGLQNGAPDGIALVGPGNTVIQFLSYEGTFTAADGPASGMLSINIGVTESGATQSTDSMQLRGTGNSYDDFTWESDQPQTQGNVNENQVFAGGCSGTRNPHRHPRLPQSIHRHPISPIHQRRQPHPPAAFPPAAIHGLMKSIMTTSPKIQTREWKWPDQRDWISLDIVLLRIMETVVRCMRQFQ